MKKYIIYIPTLLQLVATCCLLSVVCISARELPAGEMAKHWRWMAQMGILYAGLIWLSLLFSPKNAKGKQVEYAYIVSWALILLGGWEAILGLRQIYGFSYSNHSLFSLTGSFFNPGPYSGYLAMVFPICLNEYLRLIKMAKKSLFAKYGQYIPLLILFLVICVLPAGMSRSAWIAAGISSLFVAWHHNNWGKALKRTWLNNKRKFIFWGLSGGICLFIALALIFHLKKDSANGRLFMWKISLNAISERPFTGYGAGEFAYAYGMAQESYFATGEYHEWEEHVAGNPEYAFNEYLQVAMEWGVPALILCLLVVSFCIWRGIRLGRIGICGAIISLAVFSFSSYPLQLPVFILTLIVLLFACICGTNRIWLYTFSIGVVLWSLYLWKTDDYEAAKQWSYARMLYNVNAYESASKDYDSLHSSLKDRAEFMFEYGRCLHKVGDYSTSNVILERTSHLTPDPMVFNVMGQNYQKQGDYKKAEEILLRSVNRLPGRIYPYYLLAKLYAEPQFLQREKLEYMARMVMEKEPKVHSTAIREMRQEVQRIVQQIEEKNSCHSIVSSLGGAAP